MRDDYGSGAATTAGFTALGIAGYLLNGTNFKLEEFAGRDMNYDGMFTYSDAISAFSLTFTAPGRRALGLLGDRFWSFFEIYYEWPPIGLTVPAAIVVYIGGIILAAIAGGFAWSAIRGGGGRLYSVIDRAPWKPANLSAGDIIIGGIVGTLVLLGALSFAGIIK
jgi:hypothetical protein